MVIDNGEGGGKKEGKKMKHSLSFVADLSLSLFSLSTLFLFFL